MLTIRHNVMQITSIHSFASIRGGLRQDCKDVYFARCLGMSGTLREELLEMDRTLSVRMQEGSGCYCRISALPVLSMADDIRFYQSHYDAWHNGGRVLLETRTCVHDEFARLLSLAVRQTLRRLSEWKPGLNESIERNFVIKMMAWLDDLLGKWLSRWTPAASVKIVAENITRQQEYLFFYMLTLLGFDVLLLQSRCDIDGKALESGLSSSFHAGAFSDAPIPAFTPYTPAPAPVRSSVSSAATPPPVISAAALQRRPVDISRPDRRPQQIAAPVVSPSAQQRRPVDISRSDRRTQQAAAPARPIRTDRPALEQNTGRNQRTEMSYEAIAQLASSVVMIAVCDSMGQVKGSGSGIMIGRDGYILTNFHVTKNGRRFAVRIEDDEEIYMTDEVIKYNALLDLAVIRIRRRLQPIPVYQGRQNLVRGQRVVAIGSPLGLFNSVSDGIIAGFRKVNDVDMIQFTAPISHGSSGGAVLNMYGEIIGISTAGIDEGQNINLAVGYESILPFIRGFV